MCSFTFTFILPDRPCHSGSFWNADYVLSAVFYVYLGGYSTCVCLAAVHATCPSLPPLIFQYSHSHSHCHCQCLLSLMPLTSYIISISTLTNKEQVRRKSGEDIKLGLERMLIGAPHIGHTYCYRSGARTATEVAEEDADDRNTITSSYRAMRGLGSTNLPPPTSLPCDHLTHSHTLHLSTPHQNLLPQACDSTV